MFSYKLVTVFVLIQSVLSVFTLAPGDVSTKVAGLDDVTRELLSTYPLGDVRRCMATLGKHVQRFEVLPGGGWDNLQNKDMGMVSFMNYSLCRTTDDGNFLIPDSVMTIPVKTSRVETFAEMFEHWTNYTSVTSRSINAHAGLHFAHFGISGSFSSDYKHVKSQQYFDQAVTTRIQARYVRYEAKLQPDTPYMKVFSDRLKKIAAHIMLNRTRVARYESQLLVRDFGTHLVTSVDVGAALVQLDQVRAEFVRKYDSETSSIKAAASASFFGVFDFGGEYTTSSTKTMVDEYKKSRTSSHIDTIGGPIYKPLNYTANTWTDSIDNNMVALDRSGDPIFFSINEQTLPDLPLTTVYQVYNYVRAAVEEYYKHNVYRGCTKPDSPNFNFQANVDDGTCKAPETNYTFGGVFQKCSGYNAFCSKLAQKNPLTGDYSCSKGYDEIEIQTDKKSTTLSRRSCHSCWAFFHCCHDETYTETATYTAYWCAARGNVSQNNGYLFGGLYNPMLNNPLTMTKSCPPEFYQQKLLDNLVVCISDDYELGYQYSLPFAGFFSCHSGNPLALKKPTGLKSSGQNTLQSFMKQSGPSGYPRECPTGYSQHLAIIDNNCEIHFCVKYGALSAQGLPYVQRPPFMHAPISGFTAMIKDDTESIVFNDEGTVWMTMTDAETQFGTHDTSYRAVKPQPGASQSASGMNPGGVAAISIVATIVCIGLTTLIVVAVRRRRNRLYRENDQWSTGSGSQSRGIIPQYGVRGYTNMNPPTVDTST